MGGGSSSAGFFSFFGAVACNPQSDFTERCHRNTRSCQGNLETTTDTIRFGWRREKQQRPKTNNILSCKKIWSSVVRAFVFRFFLVFLFSGLKFNLRHALGHVSHHLLVVHGLKDVILAGAVVVAGAGLDEHHVLLHHLPVGTLELHGQGGGSVGGAAATVQAHAAELGPVGLGGGAAGDLKLHGL